MFQIKPVYEDALAQWVSGTPTSGATTVSGVSGGGAAGSIDKASAAAVGNANNNQNWFQQNAVPIAQTASTALQTFSTLSSAKRQASNLNANANLLDQQANQAVLNAGQQSGLIRRRGAEQQGDQDARIAASGTGFGGTNALLRRQTALNIQEDANAEANSGILQSDALKNQANSMRQQADAESPGLLSLLGAGTQIGSSFLNAKYGKKY